MKVLTLKQPWATLLARGHKLDETRSWATKFRGDFLIHSSAHWDQAGIDLYQRVRAKYNLPNFDQMPLGQIIGKATLIDVQDSSVYQKTSRFNVEQKQLGDFRPARHIFICTNHLELPVFVPAVGSLKFWNYD